MSANIKVSRLQTGDRIRVVIVPNGHNPPHFIKATNLRDSENVTVVSVTHYPRGILGKPGTPYSVRVTRENGQSAHSAFSGFTTMMPASR